MRKKFSTSLKERRKASPEIEDFVRRIVDYFNGDVTVILFGSRARGDYNRASDYDLIVISRKLAGNFLRRTKPIYELNEDFLPVDVLAYTPSEFLRALENLSPSALDAMKEGIVLHFLDPLPQLSELLNELSSISSFSKRLKRR